MFANEYHFEIQPGETKEIELVLREADLEDMLENISMPEFMLKTEDGTELKASDLTADGKHILMFLEEEKEPTEHILNEMMEQEEAFAGYAEQIIFVVRSKEALETPTLSKALAKLKNIQIYYDDFSEKTHVCRSGQTSADHCDERKSEWDLCDQRLQCRNRGYAA